MQSEKVELRLLRRLVRLFQPKRESARRQHWRLLRELGRHKAGVQKADI
ncbi:MAG: hypothetical protein PVG66_04345 [Chromatiales bacterium]|jgi:hypothetical protein